MLEWRGCADLRCCFEGSQAEGGVRVGVYWEVHTVGRKRFMMVMCVYRDI